MPLGSTKQPGVCPSQVSKRVQMGRIWRIRHKDHQPFIENPQMLEESTAEWSCKTRSVGGAATAQADPPSSDRKSIPCSRNSSDSSISIASNARPLDPRRHERLDHRDQTRGPCRPFPCSRRAMVQSSKPNYLTNSTCFYPWGRPDPG